MENIFKAIVAVGGAAASSVKKQLLYLLMLTKVMETLVRVYTESGPQ